jgi:hypothetical protein
MKKTILCNLLPLQKKLKNPFTNPFEIPKQDSILEIYPILEDQPHQLKVTEPQVLKLNVGDKIKSINGTVFCKFDNLPSSRSFILSPDYEHLEGSKYRTEIIIDEKIMESVNQ